MHLPPVESFADTDSIALEGPARSGKTRWLVAYAEQLLNAGLPSDRLLVLCSNYSRKAAFLEALQSHLQGGFSQLQVTTYSAMVRNTLAAYWPAVEAQLSGHGKLGGLPVIFPELSGFEASEYIVRRIVREMRARQPELFSDFNGSERGLVMQLIRRVRLRSENSLGRDEMRRRSEAIGEICLDDCERLLREFDMWSLRLRVLDNSKQIDVFNSLLERHDGLRQGFTGRVRHLIVDDVDETIPAQQQFIRTLAPHLDSLVIAADLDGGTRRGYLNAYPYDWEGLKALKSPMRVIRATSASPLAEVAQTLLSYWQQPDTDAQHPALPAERLHWRPVQLTRLAMLEQVVEDIAERLQREQCRPGDIVIAMPRVDVVARLFLARQCRLRGIPFQLLTGTSRPIDNPACQSMVRLIQLVNQGHWRMPLSPLEFKGILCQVLGLHHIEPDAVDRLTEAYRRRLSSTDFALPTDVLMTDTARTAYMEFLEKLDSLGPLTLDEQIYGLFNALVRPGLSDTDALDDVNALVRSLYIRDVARAFTTAAAQGDDAPDASLAAREWLIQVKTGVVSDTPNKPRELDPDAVLIGTPQKIIDFEVERPMHCWLDISSREWSRTDNAPLYNAWVHSAIWDGDPDCASDAFNQRLARTRAGHITRTLMLYAQERVWLYASETDDQGQPHAGIFQHMLRLDTPMAPRMLTRAVLREDQAPILAYRGGPMAIAAVPGAGKTFVNVELLLELIERGTPPESILVLTYMDAAARTLTQRLRAKLGVQGFGGLPVISTIHSLALRILTEGDHAVYLGLETDQLSILNDIEQQEILLAVIRAVDPEEGFFRSVSPVLSGIQAAKARRLSPEQLGQYCQLHGVQGGILIRFVHAYAAYQAHLKRLGKLDFTDLIGYAIDLLERFPELRDQYRARFSVIIEDEAQDSSLMLQRLIELLKGPEGSLIRTGDTNQSITTTFSHAETRVFRDYIQFCRHSGTAIEMNRSSRCAPEVIALANAFMQWAEADTELCGAFLPMTMLPVAGQNPELACPLQADCHETAQQEAEAVALRILDLQAAHPEATIAVLIRGNKDVVAVSRTLQSHRIQAICMTDLPEVNPVFQIVAATLAIIENPTDTDALKRLWTNLAAIHAVCNAMDSLEDQALIARLPSLQPEAIPDNDMLQVYYHLLDLSRHAFDQDICQLIVRLTHLFLTDAGHRTVGYLCALKAKEWLDASAEAAQLDHAPLEWVNREFRRCLERKRLPFQSVHDLSADLGGFVQVMTLHKAKGQEFDFVFIPGMTEKAFPSLPGKVWTDQGDKLQAQLDALRLPPGALDNLDAALEVKKREKVAEEARLVYVGLTRARRGLFVSCHLAGAGTGGASGRMDKHAPSRYFTALHEILARGNAPAPSEAPTLTEAAADA